MPPESDAPGRAQSTLPEPAQLGDTWVWRLSEGTGPAPEVPTYVGYEQAGRYHPAPDGELGRGGLGRVLATFDAQLGREIAVKELQSLHVSAERRFFREARVTAQLEHPNIVPVYELGKRFDGTLYYTMKRVRGRTLADAIADAEDPEQRLRLLKPFLDVCQAVAYAHSRGVIHRDIKPQNVMVGEFGETVLLDWGLARALGHAEGGGDAPIVEAGPGHTLQGAAMGTPAYMSPEQAAGRMDEVDVRSDLWSLGAVLFEILTGSPPYAGRTATEIVQKVVHEDPPFAVEAPEALARIAEKAMRRDPAARYGSAGELADEVLAWQSGGRVHAHAYSPGALLRLWIARHRGVAAMAAAAVVGLGVVGLLAAREVLQERDRARLAEAERSEALARALTMHAAQALREHDAAQAWVQAAGALALRESPEARGLLLAAKSGWIPTFRGAHRAIGALRAPAWSPDGRRLAAVGAEGPWLRGEDGDFGPLARVESPAQAVAWLDEDTLLAGRGTGGIVVLDAATGAAADPLPTGAEGIRTLAALPGGRVAVGTWDGPVLVWDVRARTQVARLAAHSHAVDALAASPDGRRLASAGKDATRVWDLAEGTATTIAAEGALALAFSPDGARLAAGGDASGGDGRVRLWDVGRGSPPVTLDGHRGEVTGVAWSADGRLLASAATDGTVCVWDASTSRQLARLDTGASARGVAFAPDDTRRLAVSVADGRLVEWALPDPRDGARLGGHGRAVTGLAWADADLWSVGEDGRALRWRGRERTGEVALPPETRAAALLGEELIALATGRQWLRVELVTGAVRAMEARERPAALAVTASPRPRVALGSPGAVDVFDPATGDWLVRASLGDRSATRLAFGPDGVSILAATQDGSLLLADATTGVVGRTAPGAGSPLGELAISPDGARVAAGERGGDVRVWTLPDLAPERRLVGHADWPVAVAFSPDGHRLATAGWDHDVRLWDPATGRILALLPAHDNLVWAVAFSPDGRRLASAGADREVALWDLDALDIPGAELLASAQAITGLRLRGAEVEPAEDLATPRGRD